MSNIQSAEISPEVLEPAWSYHEYRSLIDTLLEAGKTTGKNHSEAMIHYTKMNVQRMKRHDKRSRLNEDLIRRLEKVDQPVTWLILTEAWCGDAAQLIPVIQKMADCSENIQVKLMLRDENLEVMDQFLTNGTSRSIPIVICLDTDTLDVVGSWGPRPQEAQRLRDSLLNTPGIEKIEVARRLHKWYAQDQAQAVQKEFMSLLNEWEIIRAD